jgi:hypothetical protein
MVALRFSIALTISFSDFAEVEQTSFHALTNFGALITTADFGAFFAVAVVIWDSAFCSVSRIADAIQTLAGVTSLA